MRDTIGIRPLAMPAVPEKRRVRRMSRLRRERRANHHICDAIDNMDVCETLEQHYRSIPYLNRDFAAMRTATQSLESGLGVFKGEYFIYYRANSRSHGLSEIAH